MRRLNKQVVVNWDLLEHLIDDKYYNEAKEIYYEILKIQEEDKKKEDERKILKKELRDLFANGKGYTRFEDISI
jgi:hypothetical protein